jgi:hypothetical protein
MKTYTVHIQTVESYAIDVTAQDENEAEAMAWRLFPHRTPEFVENDVTAVVCTEGEAA